VSLEFAMFDPRLFQTRHYLGEKQIVGLDTLEQCAPSSSRIWPNNRAAEAQNLTAVICPLIQ
jgi:hypothetical protein